MAATAAGHTPQTPVLGPPQANAGPGSTAHPNPGSRGCGTALLLRCSSNDGLRRAAWANLFARGHPIAVTGKLSLAHATHQLTCIGALEQWHKAVRVAAVTMIAGVVLSVLACGCSAPQRVYNPGQDPSVFNDLAFVHYLAQVPVVTVDEGSRAVLMITGPTPHWPTYEQRLTELQRLGAIKDAWRLEPDQILTKGTLAYMIRTICKLPRSINESLSAVTGLGERRYALQTCVAEGVLPFGRAGDPVTGGELLTALTEAERYLAAGEAREP